MMAFSAQLAEGGGACHCPTPFTLSTLSNAVCVAPSTPPPPAKLTKHSYLYSPISPLSPSLDSWQDDQTRSRIHQRTISLRFLGIILKILRLEVSVWKGVRFSIRFSSFLLYSVPWSTIEIVRGCVSLKKYKSQGKAVEVTVNSLRLLSGFRPIIRPQGKWWGRTGDFFSHTGERCIWQMNIWTIRNEEKTRGEGWREGVRDVRDR